MLVESIMRALAYACVDRAVRDGGRSKAGSTLNSAKLQMREGTTDAMPTK